MSVPKLCHLELLKEKKPLTRAFYFSGAGDVI
jgi:hypothetical protein